MVVNNLRIKNILSDIYIIDDNSLVKSKLVMNYVKNNFVNIKIIKNFKNLGQGGSIKKAFSYLKIDV